ncbi:MAG: hypothetical protein M1834_006325 [Cirrosporium novae-zelandiae]|nr:MAG: hypothetical protein M1834_006325 [Cirrosporium novae-zelandiae]
MEADNEHDRGNSSVMELSPARAAEPDSRDPRQTLQHVLSAADSTEPRQDPQPPTATNDPSIESWAHENNVDHADDEGSIQNDSYTRASEVNASHSMTVSGMRRSGNATIGSVYSGNKIRHLKKEDGIPLWRKDIQYEFLRTVFYDETPCFTGSDGTTGHNFADIYIDAMSKSSKTSKILKDKLLSDRPSALSMSMVCLLVNVGRMNTTLNFFPEMRAQLRTYHSIPSLQAHQDPNAYKQLQDAPRLKSILKGASEDTEQPNTVDKVKNRPKPRTNPVNLIFVLSQYAPKISELHFNPPRDFFDLVMRSTLSSISRAKAFLWLMWWYLESDFTKESALNNPFGAGVVGEGTQGFPLKVPPFDTLTEEQANAENVDTQSEVDFGEEKRLERKRLLEEDEAGGRNPKRVRRSKREIAYANQLAQLQAKGDINDDQFKELLEAGDESLLAQFTPGSSPRHTGLEVGSSRRLSRRELAARKREAIEHSESERTRSASPQNGRNGRPNGAFYEDDQAEDSLAPFRRSGVKRQKSHQTLSASHRVSLRPSGPASSPISQRDSLSVDQPQRRTRPLTAHQKQVELVRREKVDAVLDQWYEEEMFRQSVRRSAEDPILRAWRRISTDEPDYDSEDENAHGRLGLGPNSDEVEDFGEEARRHAEVLQQAMAILDTKTLGEGSVRPHDVGGDMARAFMKEVEMGKLRFRALRARPVEKLLQIHERDGRRIKRSNPDPYDDHHHTFNGGDYGNGTLQQLRETSISRVQSPAMSERDTDDDAGYDTPSSEQPRRTGANEEWESRNLDRIDRELLGEDVSEESSDEE